LLKLLKKLFQRRRIINVYIMASTTSATPIHRNILWVFKPAIFSIGFLATTLSSSCSILNVASRVLVSIVLLSLHGVLDKP